MTTKKHPNHAVKAFDKTLHKTYEWLDELAADLDLGDHRSTYAALRITLQILRDRLPMAEAVDLGAQLPMLVRGFYYDGWTPTKAADRPRHVKEFLKPLETAAALSGLDSPPEDIARAVFRLLSRHVSAGEMKDVRSVLPPELRQLFPDAVTVAV